MFYVVILDWEVRNRYQINNKLGQQVYFAAEGEIMFQMTETNYLRTSYGLFSVRTHSINIAGVTYTLKRL